MATLGLTKLLAVNMMLRGINELPASALDSTGTFPTAVYGSSVIARAEEVLDEVANDILSRGLDENTIYCETLTAVANEFQANANTLFIRPAGPDSYRKISLRGDKVVNLLDGSTTWSGVSTMQVDRVYNVTFVDTTPRTKSFIAKWASVVFQRRMRGSPDMDAVLTSEAFLADLALIRPIPHQSPTNPLNPVPVVPPTQSPQ